MYEDKKVVVSGAVLVVALAVVALLMWGVPTYNVWQKELSGKAELREAEWNKQILVEQAKAEKESATLYAEAEIERAKGVAESNKIIAGGLQNNEAYLRYLYITTLKDLETKLIYVPTEAGLPILEAGRK